MSGTVTGTNFTFTGLSCATTYSLGLAAFDAAGNVSGTFSANVATQACAGDSTPPSTPAGLATSAVGQTSATLSWSPSSDDTGVTGYSVFQGGSQVGTSATTSYAYTGLTCGTTYTLGVAAVDAAGNVSGTSTKSLTTAACPDTTPPSTPTGLSTSAVGQTSVALSWTASSDDTAVTGYRVFQGGLQVGTSATTSYTYIGLTCATTYTLGVAAVDAAGNVSGTATKNVTTAACPDTTPPSTPTGLVPSTVGQTSIALSWTASTDDVGVTGYRVFRDGSQVGTPTAPAFSFTGLTCGTTYTLGVAAVDAAGNVSGIATANVAAAACTDTTPPSTPNGLTTSAVAATTATLSWTASTDNVAVTGYRLFKGSSQVGTSATPSFDFTGLTCETSYTLGVAAVDAAGNASGTATIGVTTAACPDTLPPSTPTGLATSAVGASTATLSWTASTDNFAVTGYRLFLGGSQVGTSATTSYTYTGLTCGTTYTLGVVAVDAAGNVSGTATKSVTTAACADTTPPSTPAGLATSAVAATTATLSWTASTDNVAVTGYRLFQGASQVGTSPTTSFGYTGLTCATTYTLGVAAVDAAGNVSGTATKSVTTAACPDTTPPSTPTGLATSAIGQTSAALSWNASTDDVAVTGYRVFRDGTQVGTPTAPTFSFTGLTCGTTYTLGVAAVDAAGNVSGTATKSATTAACPDTTPPSTPTGLATSAVGQTQATLSWTAATDNVGVTGYRTFRGATQVGTPPTTSYTFTGLTCGTTYSLGVAAADAAGNISSTATTSVTTSACPDTTPPSTPTGLATSGIGQTAATLSWTASNDNVGVTGYRLYLNGSQIDISLTTSYLFTSLVCGTSYTLGVAAVDFAGNASAVATLAATSAACSGPPPTANVFVSPSGSDSTCVRGDQAHPCLSLAGACRKAHAGDVVGVQAGNYAEQTILYSDCPESAPAITFEPVSASAAPAVGAGTNAPNLGGTCNNDCGGLTLGSPSVTNHSSPSYLTFENLKIQGSFQIAGNGDGGTEGKNLTFDHVSSGAIAASGATNLTLTNSDMGNCYNPADFSGHICEASNSNFFSQCGSCGPARVQTSATFTNDVFHDYIKNSASSHGECLFPGDVTTLVVQNSWFYHCEEAGIQLEFLETPTNITIQNNWFGQVNDFDSDFARCGAIRFSANAPISNTLIRYNSFAAGQGIVASSGSPTASVRIVGNIIGMDPTGGSCSEATPPAPAGNAVYSSNVWIGHDYGTNSAHVANTAAFNAMYLNGSDLGSGNYHLSGSPGSTVADNHVPCSSGDAALNIDRAGDARPQGTTCDAGSEER